MNDEELKSILDLTVEEELVEMTGSFFVGLPDGRCRGLGSTMSGSRVDNVEVSGRISVVLNYTFCSSQLHTL